MLKSHETEADLTPKVGGNRVTPQELSQALAAIEARKQQEAGTIGISDAVAELNLDATPEEIWAEVNSQRVATARQAPRTRALRPQIAVTLRAVQTAYAAYQRRQQSRKQPPMWMFPILAGVLLFSVNYRNHAPHVQRTHSVPILRPLFQIPDGQEVYANNTALVQLSEGKPAAQITVSENQTDNRWTLVKVGGHVYLRGYIASTDSLSPLAGKALNVYNDDDSGGLEHIKTSNITLRVDNIPLQKSGGDEDFSEVTVPNFQPDPLTTLTPWH